MPDTELDLPQIISLTVHHSPVKQVSSIVADGETGAQRGPAQGHTRASEGQSLQDSRSGVILSGSAKHAASNISILSKFISQAPSGQTKNVSSIIMPKTSIYAVVPRASHRHHCLGPYNWVRQVHASQQIRPSTAKAVKRFACFWLISRTLSSDILTLLALLPPPALGAGGKFVIKKSHNTFLKKSVLSNNSDFF